MQYSLIIPVQGFCPLKIKFTQFLGGFRLKMSLQFRGYRMVKGHKRLPLPMEFCDNRTLLCGLVWYFSSI